MPLTITEDGYVCIDCAHMIANGEINPEASLARVDEVAEATAGWTLSDTNSLDEHCPDLDFSWQSCRTCRCSLGGSRMHAVKLEPAT